MKNISGRFKLQTPVSNVSVTQQQSTKPVADTVKTINNQLFFYQGVEDVSMLQLKEALMSINKLFDQTKVQLQYIADFNPEINLHIASNGGCVFSGMHMYDIISKNKYPVNTYVDGFAASAASLLFLAGKHRYMYENSFILIHQLRTWFVGTFSELQDTMQNSAKLMSRLKNIYTTQLNITQSQLDQMLKKDLWLSKQQAQKYGFLR